MKSLTLLLSVPGRSETLLRYLPLRNEVARSRNISCDRVLQRRSLSCCNGRSVIVLKGSFAGRRLEKCNVPLVYCVRRESTESQKKTAAGSKLDVDDREFDIVVFGATGLAGRYCIEQLHKSSNDNIKWAVAGRNPKKLSGALHEVSSWVGTDLSSTTVIEADVDKPESLSAMAKRTRCILNTVGPYTVHGEQMIKACLAHGTHMLDLSGELHFNEAMRNKYHQKALDTGTIIISTAGLGSVVGEVLLLYAKEHFPGHLNTFETYVTFREGPHGSAVNTGTLNSLVQISKNLTKMPAIREEARRTVFKQPWQKVEFRKRLWLAITGRKEIPGFSLPLVGADKPVMNHSEFFRREINPQYQRTQIQNRLYDESNVQIAKLTYVPAILGFLSQFSRGRDLLENYTSLLTLGMFRRGGPTREQVLTSSFSMIGIGEGWLKDEPRDKEPTHRIIVRVDGPEGYMTTSICLVQSAISLLKETDRVPMKGGHLTPGFALEATSLPQRLRERGFRFSIVENLNKESS